MMKSLEVKSPKKALAASNEELHLENANLKDQIRQVSSSLEASKKEVSKQDEELRGIRARLQTLIDQAKCGTLLTGA